MAKKSSPVKVKRSWISAHPRVVIGAVLVMCLGPFLNKAVHTDDALFVWAAQWIQHHPIDFYGLKVNWWVSAIPMWVANYNPPLLSYYLAGVAALFGGSEIALHLGCLAVTVLTALGIYSLARMWCGRPLLATMIAIFTPAFLVSSSTLMCDVAMLGLWIWALVLWERALIGGEQSRWQFIGAGVLAGLAVLTKYSAITLLPLLPLLSILRTRKPGWWLAGLAVPLFMLAGYEWLTARIYGRGLFSAAVQYAHTTHINFPGGWRANGIVDLAFAGGSLLPLLFFAPWLWRRRTWLWGGIIVLGGLGVTFWWWNDVALNSEFPNLMKHWDFRVQVVLLVASGLHLLLLVAAEGWRRRDIVTVILVLWIAGVTCFATVLNWTVNVRSFLPLVPAVVILLARRLEAARENVVRESRLWWPLIPAAVISMSLAVADFQLADSARIAATEIIAKHKSANHTVWFEGHGAFQYYMEKLGGQPIDFERSLLQPDDVVVVPEVGILIPLPAGSMGWIDYMQYVPPLRLNLVGGTESGAAGFYGANSGPVPFTIVNFLPRNYYVLKVFIQVHYNSQPANPREVQAGSMPSFPKLTYRMATNMTFSAQPEAMQQDQLATQLVAEGRIAEAIQQYRAALNLDSNNPLVMNNLAWILATTANPELRRGEEAVQLATKAVALTDSRVPSCIGTLGAAYAETGRFPEATRMAVIAHSLAAVTSQKETAAINWNLAFLYSAGKTAATTEIPPAGNLVISPPPAQRP
jgi:hypothetical protein